MSKKILIIGSINKDLVVTAPRFPKEGETILGSNFYTGNGGKGANQACAIGKLGGDVSMLGAVGDDSFGKDLCDALISNNVNKFNLDTVLMTGVTGFLGIHIFHDLLLHPNVKKITFRGVFSYANMIRFNIYEVSR